MDGWSEKNGKHTIEEQVVVHNSLKHILRFTFSSLYIPEQIFILAPEGFPPFETWTGCSEKESHQRWEKNLLWSVHNELKVKLNESKNTFWRNLEKSKYEGCVGLKLITEHRTGSSSWGSPGPLMTVPGCCIIFDQSVNASAIFFICWGTASEPVALPECFNVILACVSRESSDFCM